MAPDPDLFDSSPALAGATRVLVVDDSPDARGFLARALGEEAMQVHAAASGGAALDALAAFAPDAVLLDVDMPGMDGFATCSAMMDRHADLPVIFMTGLGETRHIVRGFEVGACDYVTKPVVIAEVVARVRSHAGKARLARSAREAVLASAVPMCAAGPDGRLLWANASATALLRAHGWASAAAGAPLPPAWREAFQRLGAAAQDGQAGADGGDRVDGLGGLRLRRLTGAGTTVVVVEVSRGETAGPALTAREAEVMIWVARGKTNRDVAEILGMSPRTVNKHLEHIYEKLGVETRTAAVAAAQRSLG